MKVPFEVDVFLLALGSRASSAPLHGVKRETGLRGSPDRKAVGVPKLYQKEWVDYHYLEEHPSVRGPLTSWHTE